MQRSVAHDTPLVQLLLEREDRMRQEAKAERAEHDAKAAAEKLELRQEMQAQLDQLREELKPAALSDEQ